MAFADSATNTADDDDSDDANYFGATATIDVEKLVSVNGGSSFGDADAAPGSTLLESGADPRFKFVLTNTGNVALSGVTLTDSDFSLAGCIPSVPTTLAVGASYECVVTAAWAAGQHSDTATASASYTDGGGNTSPTGDTDDANYFGATVSVDVEKSVSVDSGTTFTDADAATGPTLLASGADPVFQIVVTNNSNVTVTVDDISDTDYDTAGCAPAVPASLSAGATFTCEFSLAWDEGQHLDTASASVSFTDAAANTADDDDSDDANYFGAAPAIQIVKSVSVDGGVNFDDANFATGSTLLDGYDAPQFKFVVTNIGNVALVGVTLTDSDPAFNFALCATPVPTSLAVGASYECVLSIAWVAGQHTNTATASGSYTDAGGNTTSTDDTDKANYLGAVPALSIDKEGSLDDGTDDVATPGDLITYTFDIENTGNVFISGITVTDPLPGLSTIECDAPFDGTLYPTETAHCTATLTLTQAHIDAGFVSNTADVDGSFTDSVGHTASPNDDDEETVLIPQVVTLDVEKSGSLDDRHRRRRHPG